MTSHTIGARRFAPGLLRQRRRAAALSSRQLATRAGVTERAVALLEAGGRADPHVSTLAALADVLGCTVDELLEER